MTLAVAPNDLAVFPTVGLILFVVVFVVVSWQALRRPKADIARWASMPLRDHVTEPPATRAIDEGSEER